MTYTSPAIRDIGGEFIDVDFERAAGDADRMLGYNPMSEREIASLYADKIVSDFPDSMLIPESQWDGLIQKRDSQGGWLERRLVEIKDQDGEGSCVANATTTAHQIMQALHWGDEQVRILSAISVYRECAPGPNTGSNVGEVMRQIQDVGAIPSDKSSLAKADVAAGFYRDVHPDVGYRNRPASGWEETAKNFRVHEWWRLKTLNQIVSANLRGYPVVGARSSHCICFVRWFLKSGSRIFCYANSWGEDWGDQLQISSRMARGFGFDSERTVAGWASREAWCPRTIIRPTWLKL